MRNYQILGLVLFLIFYIVGCGSIIIKKNLNKYINETWRQARSLFSSENSDLRSIVENSYSILYRNIAYIEKYKYKDLKERLLEINNFIIENKANLIVKRFFEENGSKIIEKYKLLNFKLINEFEKSLEDYLKRVKETTGEIFVEELFGLVNMAKVATDSKHIKKIFEERFLSIEMLKDAIFQILQQLDIRLEENMNRFLVDIEAAFLVYLKSIGEIEFLFEPEKVYGPIENKSMTSIYEKVQFQLSNKFFSPEIKDKITSNIKKNLIVQGGTTIIGFIPGVNIVVGILTDVGSIYYENKLKEEIEIALNQIVNEIKLYIMEPYGLNLKNILKEFIENYEKRKQKLLKEILLEQLLSLHKDIFIGS